MMSSIFRIWASLKTASQDISRKVFMTVSSWAGLG
jgi:hypothetical protein